MEFTNEIFFNKPLTAGSTVIITYCGKLYREHSKDISIVYGYGDNWEYTDSTPMIETENGFEVTITLKNYNTFNFCFTNSFNIWDNNSGFNYISPISQKIIEESNKDQSTKEKSLNIDNDTLEDTNIKETDNESLEDTNIKETDNESPEDTDIKETDNESLEDTDIKETDNGSSEDTDIKETDNGSSEDTDTKETDNENALETNESNFNNTDQEDNIENTFSSLLDSLLDDTEDNKETIDISNLPGFGLQSVDQINESDIVNCDDIFSQLFEDLTTNSVQEETINQPETATKTDANHENDKQDIEELDGLMDNCELPAIQNKEDWVDKIINISYKFTKKITTSFKKLGTLIKLKAQEYGFISDKK